MRRPVIALVALVMGAGFMSSCGIGGAPSGTPPRPALAPVTSPPGTPGVCNPSDAVRIYHKGDKTISIFFDVSGQGQAEIAYALHAGDTPTHRTVATPWTQTFHAAVSEPGLSPMLTARSTDPTAPIGCQIVTSQLAMSGATPSGPHAVARCSVKVRVSP
jgi:hypothetical protein